MPFNIGPAELIIILVIALLILGPGKLPDVGAALGKSIREFRKASSDIQESIKVDTSPMPPATQAPTPNTLSQAATPNSLGGVSAPSEAPAEAPRQ